MSYIDLIVERQIAEAIARGEMDGGPLRGKPIADVDVARQPGWWAEQLVRRERSRVAHEDSLPQYQGWKRRFWSAPSAAEVSRLVLEANEWVRSTNDRLVADDAFGEFDESDVLGTWRQAARPPAPNAPVAAEPVRRARRWWGR